MTLGVAACSSSKSDTATTNTSESAAVPEGGTLIDGALVGGASLDPEEFAKVVQFRLQHG